MNIKLNDYFDELVSRKVASGMYESSEQVVQEALRLLEERDLKLQVLRSEIQKGLDSGPPISGDQVFEKLRAIVSNTSADRE